MRRPLRQRGDTIIEVVMAVTLFSALAISVMGLMNSGIAMAQRSLELTLVRGQVDAQAELLRYVRDQAYRGDDVYIGLWKTLTARAVASADSMLNVDRCPDAMPRQGFVLAATEGRVQHYHDSYAISPTYARVELRPGGAVSLGMSVQLVKVEHGGAYDAYIQACWTSIGADRPMTTGTIVRVYDARA